MLRSLYCLTLAGLLAATSCAKGPSGPIKACSATSFLQSLNRDHVLIGAMMDDDIAAQAPFDVRYLYVSGGTFDGDSPCTSCSNACTARGRSCANGNGGCAWWGCWQDDAVTPGAYIRDFLEKARARGQLPLITYYQQLAVSGGNEGAGQVAAAASEPNMRRFFEDYRFLLQQIGKQQALLHLEPDLWGYAQHQQRDPRKLPAAVASVNGTDCGDQGNDFAGLARCMIAMARKYAPNAKVGLHASPWGTARDAVLNSDPRLDVEEEARRLGDFMLALGADGGDFLAVDASDRDAGYDASHGQNTFWDPNNETLPHFRQAFAWAKALSERVGPPIVWWQVPVGNMSLGNTTNRWKDNRVEYFMSHLDEVAAAHGALVAFGAGTGEQTNPSTDDGYLVSRVQAYASGERQRPCP